MEQKKNLVWGLLMLAILLSAGCTKKIVSQITDSRKFYNWTEFVMGVDLSYVNQVQQYGGVYKDSGVVRDPYHIFGDHGANVVRVRLWHNPQWQAALNNGTIYNDLEDVAVTIQRAKSAGMAVNLDIHYSDTWADPDHQEKPAAWTAAGLDELKDSVYNYTLSVLNFLKARNLTPEMVQVGNENNEGMLFPEGKVTGGNWIPFTSLLKSGIKAVRDFSATSAIKPQIILHVAQLQHAEYWTNGVINIGGASDFDIIGLSHYHKWTTLTNLDQLAVIIKKLRATYNKKVMVVETAYPWTAANADNYANIISGTEVFGNYGVSKEEQLRYMKDLTQKIVEGGGSGIMYWEPAWITSSLKDRWGTGSSWENNAFFDFSGNTLPVMNFMTHPYKF
jgi:arabinogalactan endo-1,4-beta-galactosidase